MDIKEAIHICYVCGNRLDVERVPGTYYVRVRPCSKCNGGQFTDFVERPVDVRRNYATGQIEIN